MVVSARACMRTEGSVGKPTQSGLWPSGWKGDGLPVERQEAGAAMGGGRCGEDPGSATSEGYGEGGGAGTLLPQGSLPLYPSHSQPGTSGGPARPLGRVEKGSIEMGRTLWVYIFQQSSHEQPSARDGGILENWGRGQKPSTSLPVEVQGNLRIRRGSCRDWFTARVRKVGG